MSLGILTLAFLSATELASLSAPHNARVVPVPLQAHISVAGQSDVISSGTGIRFSYNEQDGGYCVLERVHEETENPRDSVTIVSPESLRVSCFDGADKILWHEEQEVVSDKHVHSYFFGKNHEVLVQIPH